MEWVVCLGKRLLFGIGLRKEVGAITAGNLLAPWKVGLTFRSDTVFQVEVGGHHVFGCRGMPGKEAVGSWRK